MRVERQDEAGVAVLVLSGKFVGGEDGQPMRAAVAEAVSSGARNVLLDLSGVPWMNSAGVGLLVQSYTSLRNAGIHVKFLNLNERVRSILVITRLFGVFESYSSRDEAIGSFRSAGAA
jgi:anti-sigma B factor antagonist